MTEVAQVAAVDIDDVTSENELNMSDAENKEDDLTHEEEDDFEEAEEDIEKMSEVEDEKPCHTKDEVSEETEKTHMNGVDHKESDSVNEQNESSEGVNGVAQDNEKEDAQADTNEDQNISDLALKKEKLMRSRKMVARSYVPKTNAEKGDVTGKFVAMQKAREERSRQRNKDEQQKRKEQYIKEKEYNRRKQQVQRLITKLTPDCDLHGMMKHDR